MVKSVKSFETLNGSLNVKNCDPSFVYNGNWQFGTDVILGHMRSQLGILVKSYLATTLTNLLNLLTKPCLQYVML